MNSLNPAVSTPRSLDPATVAVVAFTVIAWASAFPAIRAGLTALGPIELGAARFAIAAVPSAIFLAIMRPALPGWSDGWRFLIGGLVHVALYTTLLNFGEKTVSAGAASFIINVNPIITAGLAMLILGERFGPLAWLGTAISFAGIGLIALGEGQGIELSTGVLFILGAALCQSVTAIVQKPLFARHKALTVSAWNMVVGALALSPFLPHAVSQSASASSEALFAVVYLGIVPSLLAYATWTMMLARLPAGRASNFMYCVPPVATLMGFLWLGEAPTALGILGGVMALGGVVIVNLKR